MVSIVAPFHNQESNVTELRDRLHAVMDGWIAITSSYS